MLAHCLDYLARESLQRRAIVHDRLDRDLADARLLHRPRPHVAGIADSPVSFKSRESRGHVPISLFAPEIPHPAGLRGGAK